MNLNKGSRLGEGSIMNICTWLIQKSDEKLSVLGRIRAKSKSELYQYLIKSVRRKAFAELMIANQDFLQVPSPPPEQIFAKEIDLDALLQKQEWFQPICKCSFEPFVNSGPTKADAKKSPLKLSVSIADCQSCSNKRSLEVEGSLVPRKRQDSGFFDRMEFTFQV